MFSITSLSTRFDKQIQDHINGKTKPLGALGQLEECAFRLAKMQSEQAGKWCHELLLEKPCLFVFAGDHGIAQQGVSIAPSEVTQQMVQNFVTGGAAVNVFSRQFGWQLEVVDTGMLAPLNCAPSVHLQRLGNGTEDFSKTAAMTKEQAQLGIKLGASLIKRQIEQGSNLLAFGEMGIGNSSSAAAIMAAIMKLPAQDCAGAGTGISAEQQQLKVSLIERALALHQNDLETPLAILANLGGFEIAQITGAVLAAAEQGVPVLVDGFICTAAAMIAKLINPSVIDFLIFAHCSDEQGHQRMLSWFEAAPLLNLSMRLGEGSGAALCLPVLQAAVAFYNEMASFEQANVDDVVN